MDGARKGARRMAEKEEKREEEEGKEAERARQTRSDLEAEGINDSDVNPFSSQSLVSCESLV